MALYLDLIVFFAFQFSPIVHLLLRYNVQYDRLSQSTIFWGLSLAVGTLVTQRPPHSPGREVFPHPVPQLYSLSRKLILVSNSISSPGFSDPWTCNSNIVKNTNKLIPVEAIFLATSTIKPFERTFNRPIKETYNSFEIANYSIVVVMPDESSIKPSEELTPWQMSVILDPKFYPPAADCNFLWEVRRLTKGTPL